MTDINVSVLCSMIHGVIVLIGIISFIYSINLLPRHLPEELLLIGLVVIHGLVPFVAGPEALFPATPFVHFEAAVASLYTILTFVLTRELLRNYLLIDLAIPRVRISEKTNRGILAIALLLVGLGAYTLALFLTRGEFVAGSGRLAGRDQGTFLTAILVNIGFLVLVAPWYFAEQRRYVPAVSFTVLLLVFFTLTTPGTRLYLVYATGALISGYLIRETSWKRASLVLLATGSVMAFIVVLAYEARKFASDGFSNSLSSGLAVAELNEVPEPFNYHCHTILAVECFPNSKDRLWGDSYSRILFAIVPEKYSFGLKPRDTNLRFAEACDFRFHIYNATIPPSVPGEGYINFGLWGALLSGVIYAFVFRLSTLIWQSKSRIGFIVSPALFGITIIAVRGQLYDLLLMVLVFGVTGCFVVWVGEHILMRSLRQRPSRYGNSKFTRNQLHSKQLLKGAVNDAY